jgi:hypothetical protein
MSEAEFLNTTPRTFQNILNGHQKKLRRENEKEEAQYKLRMELHRQQLYYAMLPHIEKKHREPLEKFYPLPWDHNYKAQVEKSKPKTPEELKAFWDEIDRKERALKDKAEDK